MIHLFPDPLLSPSLVDHQRRRLLQVALSAPILLWSSGTPWALGLEITRLHPVRLFGGLVLDFAVAVLVEIAANYVADQWRSGPVAFHARPPLDEGGGPDGAGRFDHLGYKVSVVRLGVVDYRAHQRRVLALQLKEAAQDRRFAALRDEHIRVKLADVGYSQAVTRDLEPDDLFTLDYLVVPAERLPMHYRNLIDVSGARVFDRWYG
jgi:hypothetical protein